MDKQHIEHIVCMVTGEKVDNACNIVAKPNQLM